MALTQIFPITAISGPLGGGAGATKRWPAGVDAIRFVLDDAQFTDPAQSIEIRMDLSWDNKATWPSKDAQLWQGGAKAVAKDGTTSPVSVLLGPFVRNVNGVPTIVNPTHVRFWAQPGPGSTVPVNVGLLADVSPDV